MPASSPPSATEGPIQRALVSCFDKTGVAELAIGLAKAGIEIVSTGSTAAAIRDAGVAVTEVSEITGFPECLDGRVKTLHPRVHAGILADRRRAEHRDELDRLGVVPIGLVVVNLYPFADTVAAGSGEAEVIEMIDIGGPTMIRAAAKNHASVAVVVDPQDYAPVLAEIAATGAVAPERRGELARRAFAHTAAYDAAIAAWFARGEAFPAQLSQTFVLGERLRYGENPHQRAALYVRDQGGGVAGARQLHGKPLSYNNLLDADAAWGMVVEQDEPCVAIIKHTNPAGYAIAATLAEAHAKALAGDPVSAFGGIVAANRTVDGATAAGIGEVFTEVVVAPGYDDDARDLLMTKDNLRLLVVEPERDEGALQLRSIDGGLLVQDADVDAEPWEEWRTVSARQLDEGLTADLRLAWLACKHTKSNAIVLALDGQVVGVGAGQMSRVDSVRLAVERADGRQHGAVLASDAFFPFADGIEAAAQAGVTAIVQPGGSVRDDEVIAAADAHDIAMVFTGRRHFRH